MAATKKISDRQKKFADCFMACGVAQKAAVEAGYSPRYARGNAHKLVADSGVQAYIAERRKEMDASKVAQMCEINEFWTQIVRGEAKEEQAVYNPKTGKVEVVKVNPALKDRIKASELRAKVEGAFTENVNLSGKVSGDYTIEIVSNADD